jgi:hypothetical protein
MRRGDGRGLSAAAGNWGKWAEKAKMGLKNDQKWAEKGIFSRFWVS